MLSILYVNSNSHIHRLPAGIKILFLSLTCTILFILNNWVALISIAILTIILSIMAKVPFIILYNSVKPIFFMLIIIFIAQLFLTDIYMASFVILRFLTMMVLASIVTLSTRTSEMMTAIENALSFLPNPTHAYNISLAISLSIRFIPRVRDIVSEVKNAQKARGISRDWKALAIPVIVRCLKSADEISDAITARSCGNVKITKHPYDE